MSAEGSSSKKDNRGLSKSSKERKKKKRQAFKAGSALIDEDEIKLEFPPIGKGMFGEVYKGMCRGSAVAVKVPTRSRLSTSQLRVFQEEMSIMKRIAHPNVCLFMGSSFNEKTTKLHIVVELCAGDMNSLILEKKDVDYPLSQRLTWAKQAATGLAWLHSLKPNPILHRDLKLANLLYDADMNVKVADFGLSQVISTGRETWDKNPRGSLLYMGPEVYLQNNPISDKTDVHSFAMVLWEFCTRREVYEEYYEPTSFVNDAFVSHKRPPLDPKWPKSLQTLLSKMWAPDPKDRPPMSEVVTGLNEVIQEVKKQENIDLITNAIKSDEGSKFWIENFLGRKTVPFSEFASAFCKYLNIQLPNISQKTTFDDSERRLAGFRDLVSVGDGEQRVVNIGQFGKVIAWFAPLEVPFKENGFLDRIVDLLKQSYFHGIMSASEAEKKLMVLPPGSFLVRFSGRTWGGYTISVNNREGSLKHYVVFNQPGQGFRVDRNKDTFWKTIPELINAHTDSLYLQYPCGGNKYTYLFSTKTTEIIGYTADFDDCGGDDAALQLELNS
mmetsp:Transcript_477/g.652  ORF Transcript_477/g.652 Transcript_477/m.652 type:complete len:554 (-) Transcript_477:90-1751(-)